MIATSVAQSADRGNKSRYGNITRFLCRGRSAHCVAQLVDAVHQRPRRPFNQPIGVQQQRFTAAQRYLQPVAASVRQRSERSSPRQFDELRLAIADQDRREVPGTRRPHLDAIRIENGARSGRHRELGHRLHKGVNELQRPPRSVVLHRERTQRRPELAHERRRLDPMADDVADRDTDSSSRQLKHVIPIAAYLVTGRQIAGSRRDPDEDPGCDATPPADF
jgi:hypothetical protein